MVYSIGELHFYLCLQCKFTLLTHKKWQILYTFAKKIDKYCTNFVNVYKICQFLYVYNINLHCKYNLYIEILWKCCDTSQFLIGQNKIIKYHIEI